MPSIVLFGKLFCENFVLGKFPRDFQGFRPAGTQLLFSDPGRAGPRSLFCRRLNRVLAAPNQGADRQKLRRSLPLPIWLTRGGRARARRAAPNRA